MEINQQNLRSIYTAVNTAFNSGRGSYQQLYQQIATVVPSNNLTEDYSWIGEFARFREWVGERDVKKMSANRYTLTNIKFEATEGIPAEYVEDDNYGLLMPKFQDMGYAAATHPDELTFGLISQGFERQCYDGQNFFDADHPVGDASVSNMQAGSGAPWFLLDTRRPLKPLIFQNRREYRLQQKNDPATSDRVFMTDQLLFGVDARVAVGFGFWQQAFGSKAELVEDNFNDAIATMMGFKSEQGRKLGINPNLLVVGPKNRAAAKRVVDAENKIHGESNINYRAVDVLVVPWLD